MSRRPLRRRNSLPETSPFFALSKDRVVPEGSNDFQKTLHELYNPPPKNPPPFGGLANITEGDDEENETDVVLEEDEKEYEKEREQKEDKLARMRRHSSPATLDHENKTFDPNATTGEGIQNSSSSQQHKRIEGVVKGQDKARREFFVKHGRWPTENHGPKRIVKSSTNPGRGKMSTEEDPCREVGAGVLNSYHSFNEKHLQRKCDSVMDEQSEEEIHDLVLLFANSRIPRGSDAFTTVLGEINFHDIESNESEKSKDTENELPSDTRDESSESSANSSASSSSEEAVNKEEAIERPRQRVRWMDDYEQPLASVPSADEKHHARLYMKTTPKQGILKREEDSDADNENEGVKQDQEARRRVMSF